MLQSLNRNTENSVFTNMFSFLIPSAGSWPVDLTLPSPSPPKPSKDTSEPSDPLKVRKSKEITACPHTTKKHYAKHMCSDCYHKQGRKKLAWECKHTDRKHYAKGLCQSCYIKDYCSAKFEKRLEAEKK